MTPSIPLSGSSRNTGGRRSLNRRSSAPPAALARLQLNVLGHPQAGHADTHRLYVKQQIIAQAAIPKENQIVFQCFSDIVVTNPLEEKPLIFIG